ncbi:cruciform cutting endonuclease [Scheffersomyces xylosifermentans]|uniref:cruciform cutting endonuclease n=1 Tax=Scheffersomyces xylosifermentans TaxID=1304137 RepID=UPI00315D0B79
MPHIDVLTKYKTTSLNQLALLCGLPTNRANKRSRIESIVNGLNLARKLPPKVNILSIDIGIKNFSYCQVDSANFDLENHSVVKHWAKINLHDKYGSQYKPLIDIDTLIDSKRYVNYMCTSLLRDVVDAPDIVVMETQRTRSNNNAITLPNVLLNYTFENILYANLYNSLPKSIIIPMTSTNMISFWVNRFVTKESLKQFSKSSKKIRSQLFFHWLEQKSHMKLPNEIQDKGTLMTYLNLQNGEKIDDLVDSLLYNITIRTQLSNQISLLKWLDQDLNEFIIRGNLYQLRSIFDLIEKLGLDWNDDFEPYVDYFFNSGKTSTTDSSIKEFQSLMKLY